MSPGHQVHRYVMLRRPGLRRWMIITSLVSSHVQTILFRSEFEYAFLWCTCLPVWPQSGSNCPKMGKIRDFFRSDFSTFWLEEPKCTEIWSEKVPEFSNFRTIWLTLGTNKLDIYSNRNCSIGSINWTTRQTTETKDAKCTEIWSEKVTDFSHFETTWPTLGPNWQVWARDPVDQSKTYIFT